MCWSNCLSEDDQEIEAPNRSFNRSGNQTFSLTRVENVNKIDRNHLQRSSECDTTIPGNENCDLPPTYEEFMRSK